jgi:SAM-dependent methyltransferase
MDLFQRLLGVPRVFDLFQQLVGAPRSKAHFVTEHVRARAGERILDLGCGTGAILEFLPPGIEYVGVDLHPGYLELGRTRLGGRGTFICADITTYEPSSDFDVVIAYGVLHHLDDEAVRAACSVARRALPPGGRVLFAEPARTDAQSRLERAIMNRDRGRYVRTPKQYVALMQEQFAATASEVVPDGYRIPYTFVILEASR